MKKNKSKQAKIKQNNRNDFNLAYDYISNGLSWGDYKEAMLDRSLSQEKESSITKDDILQAWILGKDEEQGYFAKGGHLRQEGRWMDVLPEQTQKNIADIIYNTPPSFNLQPDTTNVSLGFQPNGDLMNSAHFGQLSKQNTSTPSAWTQKSRETWDNAWNSENALNSGLAIAGTLADWGSGMYYNTNTRLDNAQNKIDADLNMILGQRFGTGDTSYLASQYSDIQRAKQTSIEDNGGMSGKEGVLNGLKSTAQGAMTGLEVGGPWGALVGGIAGAAKGAGEWFLNRDAAERKMTLNNLKASIANQQINTRFADTANNSYKLYNFNQLTQPYDEYLGACGGKMKHIHDKGGYLNSHYDYITDPLIRVDAGGTHQENPNEGVQTSIAPDGQPNLVEEGETIIDNGNEAYVFSDRIVADEEILKNHLLPDKFAGKTYADISKELDKIIEEHKTDDISQRTFDEMIKRLQNAQEDQKYQEKAEEVAKFIDGLSEEEKQNLEEVMVEEAQAQAEQEAAAQQAAQEQAMAEQQAVEAQQVPPQEDIAQQPMETPVEEPVPSRYDQMMNRAAITDAANGGMFGRGGHLKQGVENSYVFNKWKQNQQMIPSEPVYDSEGRITGWSNPQLSYVDIPENTAYLNQDNRNWYQRNISDPMDTYLRNNMYFYKDFGWNPLYDVTPLGLVRDIGTGNTESIIGHAGIGGLGGSDAVKYIEKGKKMKAAKKAKEDLQVYEEAVKTLKVDEAQAERLAQMKSDEAVANGTRRVPTYEENLSAAFRKKAINESKLPTSSSNDLWYGVGSLPILGGAAYFGFAKDRNVKDRNSKSETVNKDKVKQNASNVAKKEVVNQNEFMSDDSRDPRYLDFYANGGHLHQNKGFLYLDNPIDEVTVIDSLGRQVKPVTYGSLNNPYPNTLTDLQQPYRRLPQYSNPPADSTVAHPANIRYHYGDFFLDNRFGKNNGIYDINHNWVAYSPSVKKTTPQENSRNIIFLNNAQKRAAREAALRGRGIDLPIWTSYAPIPVGQEAQQTTSSPLQDNQQGQPVTDNGTTTTTVKSGGSGKVSGSSKKVPQAREAIVMTPTLISRGIDWNFNNIGDYRAGGKDVDLSGLDSSKIAPTKKEMRQAGWKQNSNGDWYKPEGNPDTSNSFNWLRYAPAIGSGLQALSDALGITNKPNYYNADLYQKSINAIPTVNYVPIGSYLNYMPMDETYQQNAMRASSRSNARAIANNAAGNAGAALAGLNALNFGTTNALGDLGIRVMDYNNQMGQRVAEHNLRINAINANNSLSAQEKNQAIAAEKARLNYNLAQMRQSIEDQNDLARAANRTNLFTNIGNIGRENFIMNQVNSNMSLYYGVDPRTGNAYYKQAYNDLSDDEKKVVDAYMKQNGITVK